MNQQNDFFWDAVDRDTKAAEEGMSEVDCPTCGGCDRECDNCAWCGTDVAEQE